jgi:hypothetical protein
VPNVPNPSLVAFANPAFVVGKIIPQEPTIEYAASAWLLEATITNPTNSTISVSLYDGQGIYLFPNISIPPAGMASYNGLSWMFDGVIWVASAAGLTGRLRIQT